MKRITLLLAALMLLCLSAHAQDGKSIYQKYSDAEDVSAVYISPAMFRLIGKIPDVELQEGSVNFGPIIKTLSGLYILNIPKSDAAAQLADEVNHFVTKGHYELLMEAKDNGEVMRMYTVGDEKIVNSLVMLSRDGSETSFICLDGTMPREQLESLIAEAAKE